MDREKALGNAVSMEAVSAEQKGQLDQDWRLRGLI
jgi:hypothetical protein